METETRRFYETAAQRTSDASIRQLLGDLANEERGHAVIAEHLEDQLTPDVRKQEDEAARRLFVLQVIQPGLAGLMDGSVSTLAPVFAVGDLCVKAPADAMAPLASVQGRPGRVARRRYQHGICRSPQR